MSPPAPAAIPALAQGDIGRALVADMERMTWDRIGEKALANARFNRQFLGQGKSLAALRRETVGEGDTAIIIAAGPSIRRRDPIKAIKESGYKGAIVATDSALAYCLRAGIVPDLVVTLDPHATRIVRWFGDPKLNQEALAADDYFKRQDLDPAFADEQRANDELLRLIDRYGPRLRIALSSSASEAVARRVIGMGAQIYWWNPMLDDPAQPESATRKLHALNRLPCVNAGGNVGAACWMMAVEALGKKQVALTGVDFSYYDGTPYSQTQYYREAVALVGEDNLDQVFMRVFNPEIGAWFFTDPAYMWYRQCFLQMVAETDAKTINCTEGGILFGPGIETVQLAAFLARQKTPELAPGSTRQTPEVTPDSIRRAKTE